MISLLLKRKFPDNFPGNFGQETPKTAALRGSQAVNQTQKMLISL
jgi:hypothetical protein